MCAIGRSRKMRVWSIMLLEQSINRWASHTYAGSSWNLTQMAVGRLQHSFLSTRFLKQKQNLRAQLATSAQLTSRASGPRPLRWSRRESSRRTLSFSRTGSAAGRTAWSRTQTSSRTPPGCAAAPRRPAAGTESSLRPRCQTQSDAHSRCHGKHSLSVALNHQACNRLFGTNLSKQAMLPFALILLPHLPLPPH